jgi:hypothetical protein
MSQKQSANSKNKQVAIIICATSKGQSDGRNTERNRSAAHEFQRIVPPFELRVSIYY